MKIILLSIMFVGVKMVCSTDPAKCQRLIKFMLINACGATKREFNPSSSPFFSMMDEGEMEQRYQDMVEKGAIRGLDFPDDGYSRAGTPHVDSNHIPEQNNNVAAHELLLFSRRKRGVIDVPDDKGPIIFGPNEKLKSPLPGALKTRCCGDYICSVDDFKGFCG